MVKDRGVGEIAESMQLVAGRVAQEYNLRKNRKGAFWEDRYHATSVETDEHLLRCLLYIDFNMVRAGVIHHPVEWPFHPRNDISKAVLVFGKEALGPLQIYSLDLSWCVNVAMRILGISVKCNSV